jgi:hypothetical protein
MTTQLHTEAIAPTTLFTGAARRARRTHHWQDPHLVSAGELVHLRFGRWLDQTGRLVP